MNHSSCLRYCALLLLAGIQFTPAEVKIDFPGTFVATGPGWMNGPKPTAVNSSDYKWEVIGWRFLTKSLQWDKMTGDQGAKTTITNVDGMWLHEARLSRPDLRLMAPNGTSPITTFALDYAGKNVTAAGDGTPADVGVLLKLYDKGVPMTRPDDEKPIKPSEIASVISSHPNYYNADHRYRDTLGQRGGVYSGMLLDTWIGETQVQLPVTGDTFTLSATPVFFKPDNAKGPIYWMALAMLQEYFSADMQFQLAVGFKETMAGLGSTVQVDPYVDGNKMDNSDRAYGPFEVETFTYVSQAMYYPELYPKYKSQLAKAGSENEFDKTVITTIDFTGFYCGPKTGTLLNSPYVIGCMIGSHHVFWRIYDILSNAQRICFREMLERGKDRRVGVAALAVMYNRGITAPDPGTNLTCDSVFDISKFKKYLDDPDASDHLPAGNSEYRKHILENCKTVTDWNLKIQGNKSVPIYDYYITLNDIKAFFFGEGGDAATQGGGGLCNHFTIADRTALWNDVQAAFNALAPHWNKSPAAISYRYDWLTFMRAVKSYFPIRRALRPTSTESATWMATRDLAEGDCGCDDTPTDETAPTMRLQAAQTGTSFITQFKVTDNQGVRELLYTTNPQWTEFKRGTLLTGSTRDGIWGITVPAAELGGKTILWAGSVDSSGNTEFKAVKVENIGTLPIGLSRQSLQNRLTVQQRQHSLIVKGLPAGARTISIYSLTGQELLSRSIAAGHQGSVVALSATPLASGSYILAITGSGAPVRTRVIIR